MEKDASFYNGLPGIDAETEQGDELERGSIADTVLANWEHNEGPEIGLDEYGPLESAIRETLNTTKLDHNDHYMEALVHEFVARVTKLPLDDMAREHFDKFSDEMMEQFRAV